MKLTNDNYYSHEADMEYFSASQVKAFFNCEAHAMAQILGEYEYPASTSLLVGSYVDSYFEGSLSNFSLEHPEIFNSRTGELKADFRKAESMIERAKASPLFMEYMEGEKQRIFTGEIAGVPFKAKFDVYKPGNRIVDLKTAKDLEPLYKEGLGRISPIEYWHWDLQLAIYQALEGNNLPCYLAIITKEEPSDIRLIQIPQAILDTEMEYLKKVLPRLDAIKKGIIEPERCEHCAYCRHSRVLTEPEVFSVMEG